jgi:hypothetical protein
VRTPLLSLKPWSSRSSPPIAGTRPRGAAAAAAGRRRHGPRVAVRRGHRPPAAGPEAARGWPPRCSAARGRPSTGPCLPDHGGRCRERVPGAPEAAGRGRKAARGRGVEAACRGTTRARVPFR